MNIHFVVALVLMAVNAVRFQPSHAKSLKNNNDANSSKTSSRTIIKEWVNASIKGDAVVKVPLGGVLELECEAVGSPPPSVKWYHRQNMLTEAGFSDQNEIDNNAIGKMRSRIVIDCVMPHHQGVYSCVGTSAPTSRDPSLVTVVVEDSGDMRTLLCDREKSQAPRMTTWAQTLLEFSGRDAMLPCSAVGNPTPSIYWLTNKDQVIDADTISSHYKLLETGELLISQISWADMGTYTCMAQNSMGQAKAESFLYPVKND